MKVPLIHIVSISILLNYITCDSGNPHPLSDEFINSINEKQSLWKAGRNFREDIPMSHFKKLMGHRPEIKAKIPKTSYKHAISKDLPENFDWREKYPNCKTLNEVSDQGACGSDWALVAAEVVSDRICIKSQGNVNIYISASDLLGCCENCRFGCHGGSYADGILYWIETGIVTGGPYNSSEGCRPYEMPPCEHYTSGDRISCDKQTSLYPTCKRSCRDGYSSSYVHDRHYGHHLTRIMKNVKATQTELMNNGPLATKIAVYEDFLHYKEGIYKQTAGRLIGIHSVKLIGWGIENGTPYWLAANTWNSDWGDKGIFKILRGQNHVTIEDWVVGAIPILSY